MSQAQNSLAQNSIDGEQNSITNTAQGGISKRNKSYFGIEVPAVTSSTSGKQAHSLLTFDKNCMQCGGPGQASSQLPTLIKAFKMACLSYKPSPVVFESKAFERNQLIEAQGYLLYLALTQMKHLDFGSAERALLGGAPEQVAAQGLHQSQQDVSGQFDELLQLAALIEGGDQLHSSRA